MTFDPTIIIVYFPMILQGFWVTIEICVIALVGAFILGLLLALMRTSPYLSLRIAALNYVDVVRNIPYMVQVFLLFYTLPFFSIRLSPILIGIVSLMIFGAAYYGEVFRAGIRSVPRGQYETGLAIGLGHWQTMYFIILPQARQFVIPPMTNNTISLVKESAILSTITVPEMTQQAQRVTGITFSPFEVFLMVALLYWMLSLIISNCAELIERRVGLNNEST
jgi:His/Glu/Gln/Arg/opine family amino acid ABC transporter permease subunit